MIRTLRNVLTLALFASSVLAHAQFRDMWGTGWNNPGSAFIGSSLYWKTMTMPPKQGKTTQATATPATATPATATAPQRPRTVSYLPVRNSLTPSKLAAAFQRNAGDRKELEQAFIKLLDFFNTEGTTGPDRYNVASAAAFFMASNYSVATGKEVSDPRLEALRDALQANLLVHEKFQSMTGSQRQELHETLVIYAMLSRAGCQEGEAKGDAQQVARFKDFARQSLKAVLGVTPEQMVFTNTGLTFR